ncbi:MAG: type III-A CRISPR-associated protein Cas10/Csm1 [Cyclobacteriaceae bacterium]|nr:type III-A CRISPR-associated protein Cas10/Csm1 [Cyclobacteriaceae bacterium]
MDIIRDKLYLAALLHDIGKFYQRADTREKSGTYRYLSAECRSMASSYCPVGENADYSHKHVLWTAQFIRESELEKKFNLSGLERLAAAHHNPNPANIAERILQKADHLSSGADRTQASGKKDNEAENDYEAYKKVRMRSVLERLLQEDDLNYQFSLPVEALSLKDKMFPVSDQEIPDYHALWKDFKEEFNLIRNIRDLSCLSESLYYLLHKYTVTIPSSTIHLPDVSLFDHAKTVAAFSICLYDYLKEKNNLAAFSLDKDEEPILLIGGDLSGIQQYIYNIISTQAAKNLKGRSFYLQLLVDSIVSQILKKLELYPANVVYSSGGGFYLLAANTQSTRNQLNDLQHDISNQIFNEHRVNLYLAMDSIALNEVDIMGNPNNIGKKWKDLIEKLNRKKHARYAERLVSSYSYFFEEAESGATKEKDLITNEEIDNPKERHSIEGGVVKQSTFDQINIGKHLRHTTYLVKSNEKITHWNHQNYLYHLAPANLNVHWYFVKADEPQVPDKVTVLRLNETNAFAWLSNPGNFSMGFTFYGGNNFPTDEKGEPVFFDALAGSTEEKFRRLGVLRMDVDNLGQAFIRGFSENRRTFSRYTALSRSLDFFFRGYINTLWQQNSDFRQWSSIVYSGGDDLFIVGRWDVVIRFAEKIRESFRQWTCNNPNLTLSAGIVLVPPKFPILKAAELAGEAEEKAKNHSIITDSLNQQKNSICLLGFPLNWDIEYPIVNELKNQLSTMLSNKILPSGFLHKLQTLHRMRAHQTEKKLNQSWKWLLAYDFKRMQSRLKTDDAIKFIEDLQHDMLCNSFRKEKILSNYHFMDLLNIAARWAELETRNLND